MITTVVHLVLAGSLQLAPAYHDAPELRALERERTISPGPDGTPSAARVHDAHALPPKCGSALREVRAQRPGDCRKRTGDIAHDAPECTCDRQP